MFKMQQVKITPISQAFLTKDPSCNDWDRWSNNSEDIPSSYRTWEFAYQSQLTMLVVADGQKTQTFQIHNSLGLMLAYLDLDFWLSPLKQTPLWNRDRICRYLQCLRHDVVDELMVTATHTLSDPCFGTSTLREWAARVHAKCGHSKTGRKEYEESCKKRRLTPYGEDFVDFGKKCDIYQENNATHLTKTSDWKGICMRDFPHPMQHHQAISCPTRVYNNDAHNMKESSNRLLCAPQLLLSAPNTSTLQNPSCLSNTGCEKKELMHCHEHSKYTPIL